MILTELLQDQNPWWRDPALRRARSYPVRRNLQKEVFSRLGRDDNRRALVILGPRQVGKTVLLWQIVDDLLDRGWPPANLTYFDFSDDRITSAVTAREVAEARPVGFDAEHPRILLLDEIQGAPEWDRWLKQAVDAGGSRIVVTDSAASLLRAGSRESGQGRWDEVRLEGLSFVEFARLQAEPEAELAEILRRRPNLVERYLAIGGFPEHVWSENLSEVRHRLRSDIADRALLRDLARFVDDVQRLKNLFVYLLQDSGAIFDATARARDLDADARMVRKWEGLIRDTLLILPLERLTRQPTAGLRSKAKLYAADPGLVSAFAVSPSPEVRAKAFEAAVFRHLREAAGEREVYYFRQDDALEVDFVLTEGDRRIAVEVTSATRLRPEKIERLRRAGKAAGAERLVLIHGGFVEEKAEGVKAVALSQFLRSPEEAIRS